MKVDRRAALGFGFALSLGLAAAGCGDHRGGDRAPDDAGGGATVPMDGMDGPARVGTAGEAGVNVRTEAGDDSPADADASAPATGGANSDAAPGTDDSGLASSPDGATQVRAFIHPGLPLTIADLSQLKTNLNAEPWKSAYGALAADSHSQLTYAMQGPFATVSRTPNVNLGQYANDMQAVFNLARMWSFTANSAYAQKAHDIILSWAKTHTAWGGAESYLTMGDYAYRMYGGVDILRGTWPGWTPADTAACKAYFANVYWSAATVPNPLRSANQGVEQLITGVGVAVFNDDTEKFNQCLQAFRADAAGGLPDSLPSGAIGDSGRDQGHAFGQLMHLAWIAEVFWKQGVDVYSELDSRLLAAGEFYSRYNLGVNTPFMQFGSEYDIYPTHGGAPGSSAQPPDVLNLLHGAYVVRRGLSAPYLTRYRNAHTETSDSFVFRKSADGSTASPPAALIPPAATASVTTLSSADIGGAAPAGSSTYAGGTWTIQGAGVDIAGASDSFRFAYLPVTGNAAIVARVTSVQNTAGDAKAGVMIRESLSANAKMMGVYMLPQITINANTGPRAFVNMRGQTASSHGLASQTHRLWDATTVTIPYWLKLERLGSHVTAYHSTDGASWSTIQRAEITMTDKLDVGLAVSSRMNGTLNTATFTNVRITGGDGGEPLKIPAPPFALYGAPGDAQVPLRWLESFGAANYVVERSATLGGPYMAIATIPGTSYVDTGLTNGTPYHYTVRATNASGESVDSPEEIVTPVAVP